MSKPQEDKIPELKVNIVASLHNSGESNNAITTYIKDLGITKTLDLISKRSLNTDLDIFFSMVANTIVKTRADCEKLEDIFMSQYAKESASASD